MCLPFGSGPRRHAARPGPPAGGRRGRRARGGARENPARGPARHVRGPRAPAPAAALLRHGRRDPPLGCAPARRLAMGPTPGRGPSPGRPATSRPRVDEALGGRERRRLPQVPRRERDRPVEPGVEGLRRFQRRADGAVADGPIALVETQAYAVKRPPSAPPHCWRTCSPRTQSPGACGARRQPHGSVTGSGCTPRKACPTWRWHSTGAADRSTGWEATWGTLRDGAPHTRRGGPCGPATDRAGPAGLPGTQHALPREPGLQPARLPHGVGVDARHSDRGMGPGSDRSHHRSLHRRARPGRVAASSGYRWPELYSADPVLESPTPYPASCRPQLWAAASAGALVQVLLGVRPDAPAGRVRLAPLAPSPSGRCGSRGCGSAGPRGRCRSTRPGTWST